MLHLSSMCPWQASELCCCCHCHCHRPGRVDGEGRGAGPEQSLPHMQADEARILWPPQRRGAHVTAWSRQQLAVLLSAPAQRYSAACKYVLRGWRGAQRQQPAAATAAAATATVAAAARAANTALHLVHSSCQLQPCQLVAARKLHVQRSD